MAKKHVAALAALAIVASPSYAFDPRESAATSTMFYVSVPLDGRTPKEQAPVWGLQLQGKRDYQAVKLDTRLFNFVEALGAVEGKWIVAGALATTAAVAVYRQDRRTQQQYQQQQQEQIDNGATPPPPPHCNKPVVTC